MRFFPVFFERHHWCYSLLLIVRYAFCSCCCVRSTADLREHFSTLMHFLPYTPLLYLVRALPHFAFIKVSLGADSPATKTTGLHTMIQNKVLAEPFL